MQDFMNYFMMLEKIAVEYSNAKMLKNKKEAIAAMQKAISFFKSGKFTEKEAMEECKNVNKSVTAAIDPLAVVKDNVAYTFGGALEREIEKYFFYLENNPKEEKRFDDSYVRKTAIKARVPYMTTMAAARATAEGIATVLKEGEIGVMSLQEIHKAIQQAD